MATRTSVEQGRSDGQTVETSKTVSSEEAFRFYRGVGQPLDISSRSLAEFADAVLGVDPDSVKFHVERGDFERWFRSLGEQALANQVSGLRGKGISPQELRDEIGLTVGLRVKDSQQGQQRGGAGFQTSGHVQGQTSSTTSSGRSNRQ
jgi:hypothetical protein